MTKLPQRLNLPQIPQTSPINSASQFKAPLTPLPGVLASYETPNTPVPTTIRSYDYTTNNAASLTGSFQHTPSSQSPSIKAPGFGIPRTLRPTGPPDSLPLRYREQVLRYNEWLVKQTKQDVLIDKHQEMNEYIQYASQTLTVEGNAIATFAPFRAELSALQTFTKKQVLGIGVLALLVLIGIALFRLEMLAVMLSAITITYFGNVLLSMVMAARSLQIVSAESIDDEVVHALKDAQWPAYTILCPLYKEAQVVPQFVQAMQALDYPANKLQILFLTETDDRATRDAIRSLNLPKHFKIVTVPDGKPRTKPRACNYGLMQTTGTYVVIFDAEDVPDPLQLKKAVLTFANNEVDVACVQAKLNFYNIKQNVLTRWFTIEYTTWFDLILPGLQQAKFSLPLGGTSNHFRTSALRALGAWDAYNVTEDCDLGLRLSRYRLRTVVLDSTTYEEANSQVKNWIRQRSRWIKGYMQTYLVHMRNPMEFLQKGRLYELFSFQVVVGCGIGFIFLNPLMWLMLITYLLIGPSVIGVYHLLFPGPTLYMAEFCLIFGNFFYIYLYLFGCMKRKQFDLMPWAALIPFYWLLMTIAGMVAFWELLAKPHYWQKTVHGLHLKGTQLPQISVQQQVMKSLADEQTTRVAAIAVVGEHSFAIPTVTKSFETITTIPLPALSQKQKQQLRKTKQTRVRDLWLVATIVTSCIASIGSCYYYLQQHEITLYQDALSHMRISRGVFDSVTPGLAQLGTVWLPLPHILMWPFIWNDYLWHSGLAGSFVSMPCYVIATIYLFLSARRLTKSSSSSFIGTLAFILNPNVLYLQSTPLSETVCIATLSMACYYFLMWTQENTTRSLIFAAACTFLATLARYDGWALFLAMLCFISIVGCIKHQRFIQIQSNLILFGILSGLGIVLWLIWNKLLFGDPLYFQHSGVYSSQAQQMLLLKHDELYTYHNLWQSIRYYAIDSIQTVGLPIFCLAVIGMLWFMFNNRINPRTLSAMLFLVPFVFYVVALYSGNAVIWIPGATPTQDPVYMYNVRYGAQIVLPAALCIALLAGSVSNIAIPHFKNINRVLLLGIIVVQCMLVAQQGIISLQDGQYAASCRPQRVVNDYLAQHYNGGKILIDVYAMQFDPTDAGINFHNVIYEGSYQIWQQTLQDPARFVQWVIVKQDSPVDLVAQHLNVKGAAFLSQFTLVVRQSDNIALYHRKGLPPLPSYDLLPHYVYPHHVCLAS